MVGGWVREEETFSSSSCFSFICTGTGPPPSHAMLRPVMPSSWHVSRNWCTCVCVCARARACVRVLCVRERERGRESENRREYTRPEGGKQEERKR